MDTTRLEAFSDGVFAIAITLLVLLFSRPSLRPGESLGHALLHQWPGYVSYVVSFGTIGIIWVNHHAVFRHIARADRVLLFLNVLFLMCIAFIPYPTELVAEFARSDGARAAALLYGVNLTVTALMFNAVWHYAAHGRRLLMPQFDAREVTGITRSYIPGPFMYGGATLMAFASPTASVALYVAIALFYVLSSSVFGRDE